MDRYLKHGFEYKDLKVGDVIRATPYKELYVNIYSDLPSYNLLSNMKQKNVTIKYEDGRIIFENKDKTIMSNIGFNDIGKCMIKRYGSRMDEFIFEVCGVYYKCVLIRYK